MRILLDESLPHDLAPLIDGHVVSTVRAEGWPGIKNGKLLALAATSFDAFVSADRNLEFQQNLATLPLAVVVLLARRRPDPGHRAAAPAVAEAARSPAATLAAQGRGPGLVS